MAKIKSLLYRTSESYYEGTLSWSLRAKRFEVTLPKELAEFYGEDRMKFSSDTTIDSIEKAWRGMIENFIQSKKERIELIRFDPGMGYFEHDDRTGQFCLSLEAELSSRMMLAGKIVDTREAQDNWVCNDFSTFGDSGVEFIRTKEREEVLKSLLAFFYGLRRYLVDVTYNASEKNCLFDNPNLVSEMVGVALSEPLHNVMKETGKRTGDEDGI